MSEQDFGTARRDVTPLVLRAILFLSAATLALYIPFKYATQLHAITGLYAFLFPLSGLLAAGGLVLAVKPEVACDCSTAMRIGGGGLAFGWMATGLMCTASLTEMIREMPLGGSIAMVHMLAQHVVLSMAIFALAVAPARTARMFGAPVPLPTKRAEAIR